MNMQPDPGALMLDRLTSGDHAAQMRGIARSMLARPLMKRDFEMIHEMTKDVDLNGRVLARARAVNGGLDSSSITSNNPYLYEVFFHEKINEYSHIAKIFVYAEPQRFLYSARSYPVFLRTSHIQGSHFLRAKRVLDYGDSDFMCLLGMGLILSKLAETHLEIFGETRAVMHLPVKNGLFLGTCALSTPEVLDKVKIIRATRPPLAPRVEVVEKQPLWRPKVEMRVGTYIDAEGLREGKQALFDLFQDALNNDSYDEIIPIVMAHYLDGEALTPQKLTRKERRIARGRFIDNKYETSTPPMRPGTERDTFVTKEEIRDAREKASQGYDSFYNSLRSAFQSDRWRAYSRRQQSRLDEPEL
jgi:hypothetical protein